MITFRFVNGSVITVRNSGTEPKVKYYVECQSKDNPDQAKAALKKLSDALINLWLRPNHYELIAPQGK